MDTMDEHFTSLNGVWSPKIGLKQHPLPSEPTPRDVENKSGIYTPAKSHSLSREDNGQSSSILQTKSTGKSKRKALSPLPLSSSNIQQQHTPHQLDSKTLMKVLSSPDETFKSRAGERNTKEYTPPHADKDVFDDSSSMIKSLHLDEGTEDERSAILLDDSQHDIHAILHKFEESEDLKLNNVAHESKKYTIQFIPGNMGLDLEPVIISSDSLIGCKVKDFYFGLDHSGITPEELLQQVKLGDVIDTVNGTCVVMMPFKQIINMLMNLKNTHRQIVFKRFASTSTNDGSVDLHNKNKPLAPTGDVAGEKHMISTVKSTLLLSPREVKRISQAGPFSPGTYAHLTAFESACITPEKGQGNGNVKFDPPIVTIPKTIHKTLRKVVNVVGEKAVEAAKVVTGHETVLANKNALLSELSHCCVMLGVAEERESRYVSEQKSLKLREADLIGKLGDAEFKIDEQNSKLVALQLEIATLQADKDVLSSKCDVLEDELYSSRLLLESQNTKMVEQLKGDIDEKFSTITSLRSQLQSEKSNNTKEMIALKEQFQKEKDEMQALYDKKAVENKEHLEKLNEEHENLLQNLNQLQNDASIESSAHQEKLQALEQKLCEVQEIHRVEMDQKMHEIEELQGELKLQAEQNQMALQAVRDDQTDLEVKLSDSKSLVIEKEQIVRSTTAEVQRLTSLLEESKSQLSILTLESSDMEEMSKLFEKRVESSQNEIDALKKELSVCKEQLQANEDHRVLSQNSYITLEAELKVSKESCIDLEEANARLMKEIEILSSSHESQLDEKAEIQEAVVNLEKEKEALKEEMMQAHSQSERYRRELEEVKTQFTMSHKEQIENLQDQITSLRRNRDGLEVQKQAVTAANECHQEMIEGLKNEAEEYRKSITLLTREIDTAKELNEKLTNSVDLLEKITLSHETTIKEKGVLVSSLEEKCRQHEEEYRTAMDRVYGLEQTCEDLSMKLKGASDMLADNENCYSRVKDVMKEEKERLEEKLKDSKEEFDEMKNRLLDAEAALEEKDASMQSYQHEISVLYSSKKNFEARLAENEEVIEQYAMQVQALKVENETMKGDDEIVKTMQVALELNSKTVESLTEELDEKNAMVEEMKQHCRNLEKAAEVTASRIGDLDEKNLRAQAELENLLRLKDESLQDTRKELIEMRDAYRALLTDQSSQKDQDAKGLTGLVDTLKELTEENKVKSIELATLQSSFNDQTSELREYKDRYTEYKALGEQLTVEIEQVSSQNASLKKDLSEKKSFFEAEKNQFESIVVAKSVEIDRLNEDSKSQASLCNTLKEEKMKVEAFLQSVKDERDKVLKEYMDYKKEIAENKSNTDTSMAIRLQELHTELSTLESSYSEEVLTFKSSNSKMQAELDSARNNAASLETSLVSKSALVKKLELEKNDLIDQMKNMETREKELSTLVVTLTTETGQLQGQTVELREQNVELQEQLDKAYKRQEDVDTAVKSLDVELRKQLKQVEEERNSLTSQLANASKQLDVHVSTIDLLKADRPALTATVSKLQDEINAGRARMELLSGENKELTVLNDEQRTQLEDLQNKLDTERSANAVFQNVQEEATKNKEEVIILKGTIKELQTQLNMSEQESIELSVELTSLKDQVTTLRAQQDSTKMKMQGDTCALEKIVDENNVLNGTVNELLCSNNDLKVSLSTLEERCCNLEQEIQNLTVELETSKAETKELEEAKNTLDETLLSMQNELMGLSKAMEGLVDMHELEEERKKHEDAMDVVMKEKESAYSELSQSRLDLKQAQDLIFELTNRLESSNVINSSHKRDENDKISTTAAESMKVQQLQKTVAELESKLITRSRAEKQAMHVEKALRDEIDTLTQAQSNSTEKLIEAEKTINQLRLSLSDMKKEDIKYRRVVADLQRAIIAYESQLESSNDEKILDDNTDSSKEDHNGEYEASFKLTAEAEEEKIRSDSEEVEANRLLALQHLYQLQAGIRVSDDYKESWERLYGGLSSPSPFNDDIQLDQLTSQVRHLQSELTSLQATCTKKDDILQRAQSLVTQLKDDNLGKDTLLADVRAELHAKEEEVEFLQTEIASKENTCSQSRQQVLKLSADIDDMNELLTKVQSASKTSTASYESTLEDMTAMCQTLTEERDNLQLAVNESEALQEDMKISIEEFKTSLQSKQRSLDEIEASNAEILSTMNIMSLALSEAQEREGEYAQTTTRLQAEIHELQKKLQDARGSNSEVFLSLEGKLQIATEQLVVAKSRAIELEEQLSAKNYELSSLRNHYMTFNAETGSTDVSSSNSRTSNELENGDEVLRASLDSMDSVILSEIMDENARITRNCVESMIKRRNVRYKYTSFLALKRCCKDDHDHVDADDSDDELLQGEMFVDQDSCASADIFNISADSIAIDA